MTSPAVRTALVTGGTRGIGLGIARALAADGWGLVICGMRPEKEVGSVLEELRHQGGPVEYVAADIASIPDRARLVELTHARAGAVQALVNNAGRAPDVRADLLDATEVNRVMQEADGSKRWYLLNLALWWRTFIAQDVPRSPVLAHA